jgi:hypothetical protein
MFLCMFLCCKCCIKQENSYQRELSVLKNEQRKRQQKEFEDSKKYHLQCEQYQQSLLAVAGQLGRDMSDLARIDADIHTLRQKMQEVFYDQVDEQAKAHLNDRIAEAEESAEQRREAICEVDEFLMRRAGEWLDAEKLLALLGSNATIQDLRKGQNQQVLFFDRVANTLKQIEDLVSVDKLDRECVSFLLEHKIANCVTYMESIKDDTFRNVIALDLSMDIDSLRGLMAKITPTMNSATFGNLSAAVHKKVSQVENQIQDIQTIISEMGASDIIDEVCGNLRESLEGENAQQLRSLGSKDILFLDKVLHGLEQIRTKQPLSEIDDEVVRFLTGINASIIHTNYPELSKESGSSLAASSSSAAAAVAPAVDIDVDFLGSDVIKHSAAMKEILGAAPEEHRAPYRDCLEKCLEIDDNLKKIAARASAEKSGKDWRNERRSVICQSTIFLQRKLDEVPGKTKRCLLSHIFQLVISAAATQDLMTILELSIIPSCLCLGNIEKSRIFHNVVKASAPVCVPRLDVASAYFDRFQRVRVVGMYAAQVSFCVELNTLVGLSPAGLENTLETVWHWFVSCGNALSHFAKRSGAEAIDTLCEICDSVKLFLDIAGSTLLNFLGSRFKQFLLQPLRQVLSGRSEEKALRLSSFLDEVARTNILPCVPDMFLLMPFSCFARVKKW